MLCRLACLPVLGIVAVSFAVLAVSATTLPGFRSPSGNIRCFFIPGPPGLLRCEIAHADYAGSLQNRCMSGPSVDWHGFELGATRAGSITCAGGILYDPDTEHPRYVTLPYGRSWRQGAVTCSSRITGVTCRSRTGHGLFISRQSWQAW